MTADAAADGRPAAAPAETIGLRFLVVCGYAIVLAVAVRSRAAGLNPPSLWDDDLWVGLIVKHARPVDLFTYAASVPMGFCAVLEAFAWIVHDPELSLQLFPF